MQLIDEPTFAFLGHTTPLGRFVATGCKRVASFECVARIARDVHNTVVDHISRVDGCFVECREPRTANNWKCNTVVPVMNGHPRDQAKVSVHCRWPLVTGTDGQAGDAKCNTPCNTT